MPPADTLLLVDGTSYLFRAFHALPPLTNSKGVATGAVYGVANMLRKLLASEPGARVAVVLDAPGPTFRDHLYPEYKAHRPPSPPELIAQIPKLTALVQALGLPLLQVEGVEADDVIGTLAERGAGEGMRVLISTSDKDMAQLVSPRVTMVNTMDGVELDPAGVERKFGVPPERIVDYLALVGDPVDNVPGVPKVGPKTAARWLAEWGSLEALSAHAGEIPGKVGENLRASLGQLPMARELVTIRRDVALPLGLEDLRPAAPDREALRALCTELEFRSWLEELLRDEARAPAPGGADDPPDYRAVLDAEDLARWAERLAKAEAFAFDTETTSLDYMRAELVGVSFALDSGEAAYVPVAHDYPGAPAQLALETVLETLRPLLEREHPLKIGQNIKYDMSVLARHGVALAGIGYDTMLESYVLDSTASRHDLDSMALKYLGHRTIHYEEVAGKGAKQIGFAQVRLEEAVPYAAEDADICLRLHRCLWPRLEAEPASARLFREVEMPLVPVLSRMERNGVCIDTGMLARQSAELSERMHEVQETAFRAAGGAFNIGSPQQIQKLLFGKLGLPVRAKTPKGQPSTAESVLEELAFEHELPRLILEYRALAKLKSTYTDALPDCVNAVSGRVHTSYQQAVASTGRLSSSAPNLQNIPVRTAEGRRIRQAFVAAPGYRLLAADYSQIELRIMAHLSGDEGLLAAFAAGEDIHRHTAGEVFGLAPEEVGDEQRRRAKAINFGLIYGMSAFGLARQLGITREEAQGYMDAYFARYPGVRAFMDATRRSARERGFVETVFGRRLYLPDIRASNSQRRQYAERTAINAPMQGTAADIIKKAMISLDGWLQSSGADARMIMQVHDELVFEVADACVEELREVVRDHMTEAAQLRVALEVSVGTGANWDEAH